MNIEKPRDKEVKPVWQPRFGLATMLMVMLVFCLMAAAGNYLRQAVLGGTSVVAFFVIFTLVAPILLLVMVSGIIQVLNWMKRKSRR